MEKETIKNILDFIEKNDNKTSSKSLEFLEIPRFLEKLESGIAFTEDELILRGNLDLSETDITLISFGIILTFFSSNKEKLNKVLQLIKEKKLITFFDRALDKSYELREALFDFIESLNITFSKVSSMISYTFLVPLVPLLKDISDLSLNEKQLELITLGVSHYLGGIIASQSLFLIIQKIIKRFRS